MPNLAKKYILLTQLPLFRGVSSTDLLNWEESLNLHMEELPASQTPFIWQGDPCGYLLFLVDGVLQREKKAEDGTYTLRSHLMAPAIIEADRLYGLSPTYEYSYRAETDIRLLAIRKAYVSNNLMKNEVFRINLLNLLSATAQKRTTALIPKQLGCAEERLQHFLASLFAESEGEAEIAIRMKDLANYIGETRLTVSQILNRWYEEGIIRMGRGKFTILDVRKNLLSL